MGANSISSRFLEKNIESCIGLGISKEGLLSLVPGGLPALKDPTHRFEGEVLYLVLKYAEHVSGDPAIGFKCGLNHGHATYRDIAYTILFCENLRQSFEISERFEPIAQQFGVNQMEIGEMVKVRHTNRAYLDNYTDVFGCSVEYGARRDVLTFDKQFLEFPLPGANARMLSLLTKRLEQDLKMIDRPVSERQRVAGYIESLLGNTPPNLNNICKLVGLSERTLHRRLRKENTSFREILEEVRRERYSVLSAQENLTQVQIAAMLGYSEQSAFSRAYKSWFGVSPLKDKNRA